MNDSTPAENPNNLQPKQLVKFVNVVDKGDENARFTVVELRGPRVLVQDLPRSTRMGEFEILPTSVYLTIDLIQA